MTKTHRVKNNFWKWILRSVPYFLVMFFIFINVAVFSLQPNSYIIQSKSGWIKPGIEKSNNWLGFKDIYIQKSMFKMDAVLKATFLIEDEYPRRLEDLSLPNLDENWIYIPTFKNYDLIYGNNK